MTTTHTFQGLNTESRPSSRVLNPPGGSSSNIFGYGDQPKQQACIRSNSENDKERSDAVLHSAAVTAPQQKPGAPRSGDDSFHSPFGIYQSSGYDKAPGINGVGASVPGIQSPRVDSFGRICSRSKYSGADTFRNIFGEGIVQQRKMFRSINHDPDDSFSRVFGQKSLLEAKEGRPIATAMSVMSVKSELSHCESGVRVDAPIIASSYKLEKCENEGRHLPISQVLQGYQKRSLARRFPPKCVFNPITGEMYEKVSQEPPPPGSVSKSAVNYDNIKEVPKSVTSLNNDQLQTGASAPKQRQNQNQGGVFGGGAEDVKEHRSTRVSQPPGGHSTKLW